MQSIGRSYLFSVPDGCCVWSPGFSRPELAYCHWARNFFTRTETRKPCRLKAGLQTFRSSRQALNMCRAHVPIKTKSKCQGFHGRCRANYRCCIPALAGFVSPHSMGPGKIQEEIT